MAITKVEKKIKENVLKFAKEVGLDTEKLKQDMNSEIVSQELANTRELAQDFEIKGTPYLIIEGKTFPGAIPYTQIMEALDK